MLDLPFSQPSAVLVRVELKMINNKGLEDKVRALYCHLCRTTLEFRSKQFHRYFISSVSRAGWRDPARWQPDWRPQNDGRGITGFTWFTNDLTIASPLSVHWVLQTKILRSLSQQSCMNVWGVGLVRTTDPKWDVLTKIFLIAWNMFKVFCYTKIRKVYFQVLCTMRNFMFSLKIISREGKQFYQIALLGPSFSFFPVGLFSFTRVLN